MDADVNAELAAIEALVGAAGVPEAPRQAVAWSLKQLPRLYAELMRTYESRYADEILTLVKGMRQALADGGVPAVGEDVVARFGALHRRHGIPSLDLKPLPPPKRPRRKAAG